MCQLLFWALGAAFQGICSMFHQVGDSVSAARAKTLWTATRKECDAVSRKKRADLRVVKVRKYALPSVEYGALLILNCTEAQKT